MNGKWTLTLIFEELFILFNPGQPHWPDWTRTRTQVSDRWITCFAKGLWHDWEHFWYFRWTGDECLTFFPNAKHRLQKICCHFLPNLTNPRRHHPLGPQRLKWLWMAGRWSRKKNPLWQICRLRLKNWEWLWTCCRGNTSEYCFKKIKNHFSIFVLIYSC